MGDIPIVRFQNSTPARTFAYQLMETLDLLTHLDPQYAESSKAAGGDSTLLIIDRSVDCCGPLMHELTYNCFLQDVYPLEGMIYKHTIKQKDGTTQDKDMLLDDHDPVWMKLHHMHIADASKEVDKNFAEFRDANAALNVVGKKGTQVTTSQLSDAVHAMPQMQEKMSRFSMHMDILRKLNIIFRESSLEPVIALEQRMVTGEMEDATKTSTKDIENDLQRLLRDDMYPPDVKTRLLLLFVLTQGLPAAAKREQLLQMAKLTSGEDALIDKLSALVKLSTERKMFGKKKPKRVGAVKEGAYDLSRYETAVKGVVESLAKDGLSNAEYPFVKEPPSSNKASTSGGQGKSLRPTGATWSAAGGKKPGGADRAIDIGGGGPPVSVHGPRLYVFIVGGVTHAEIRGAHEVMLETKREIYIGGTNIVTASDFVRQLEMLVPPPSA
jgi:syntaxin-binding protein 1